MADSQFSLLENKAFTAIFYYLWKENKVTKSEQDSDYEQEKQIIYRQGR